MVKAWLWQRIAPVEIDRMDHNIRNEFPVKKWENLKKLSDDLIWL